MSKPKITEAGIIEARAQGHVSFQDIAKFLGYGGTSGKVTPQTIEKIRETVEAFEKIRDTIETIEAKTLATPAPVAPAPAIGQGTMGHSPTIKPFIPTDEKMTVTNVKSANPFGNTLGGNSLHHQLFGALSDQPRSMTEAIRHGMNVTGRNEGTIKTFLSVLCNPSDPSNGGKSRNIAATGIHLASC